MSKRNLAILLMLPFVVSLLSVSVITTTFNLIDSEILSIGWDYNDTIGVKVDSTQELKAYGINNKNYPVTNAKLLWKVENSDSSIKEPCAEIVNGNYLKGLKAGNIKITCTNEKGTVYRAIDGIVFTDSAIFINTAIKSSQSNVNPNKYYGQYDLDKNGKKKEATFDYQVSCLGGKDPKNVKLISVKSLVNDELVDENGVAVDNDKHKVTIKETLFSGEKATLKDLEIRVTFAFNYSGTGDSYTSIFKVVNNGVNVYNYDDLMYCTNKSENGEIVVLKKSLESFDNAYTFSTEGKVMYEAANNISQFGKYKETIKDNKYSYSFDFSNDIYQFETTYNHEFIKQWNELAKSNKKYKETTDKINVGIHVQKDFYGNGYTINLHNLTYPYSSTDVNGVTIPALTNKNLFRGPLPFYMLGDPNSDTPLIAAYGQDNIGMYVEGNDINIDDLVIKNCDFGNNLQNLNYTGTVMEVNGNNINITNSRLSNGKNVLRVMSSKNVNVTNCMLSYSQNFLLTGGSNKYIPVDDTTSKYFYDNDGEISNISLKDALYFNDKSTDFNDSGIANDLLNKFLFGIYTNYTETALSTVQKHLNQETDIYDGSINITDSLFYMSGIASIGMETMFNGPFLYNSSPGIIKQLFSAVGGDAVSDIIPLFATNVGGTSLPIEINVYGKTKFYDYKKVDTIDLSGLILENISPMIQMLGKDKKITIDDIFPLIKILRRYVENAGGLHRVKDENGNWTSYVNIAVASYGGGNNLSKINFANNSEYINKITDPIPLSFLDEYMNDSYKSALKEISLDMKNISFTNMLLKCVPVVTGFNPFMFTCTRVGYLYDETPKVQTLINNYKDGN